MKVLPLAKVRDRARLTSNLFVGFEERLAGATCVPWDAGKLL